jgi:3-methylcrotonyl-CoA carboxylase beta subunit
MIIANDATVKAGAFFPMTAKKVLRAQTIALENRIPTLYLVDSSGVFLPLQEDVFPDTDDFGRVFRNNAVMSSLGIPQITAIMGMCVAGGAYLPVMTDTVLMTEGSGLFLAGPRWCRPPSARRLTPKSWAAQACTPRSPAPSTSKSRTTTSASPACARWSANSARACPPRFRVGKRRVFDADFDATAPAMPPKISTACSNPAPGASNVYDMHEVIARIVDRSEFDEYKADFGRTVSAATRASAAAPSASSPTRRVNQNQTVAMGPQAGMNASSSAASSTPKSAQKAARFIMDCNQSLVPLIFLHDVNGFMVGKDAEWSRHHPRRRQDGLRRLTSVVPKITSSSAAASAPATTPCAARPTIRASSSPGPPRATP